MGSNDWCCGQLASTYVDFAHGGLVCIRGRPARTSCGQHRLARAQLHSRFPSFPALNQCILALRLQCRALCLAPAAGRISGLGRGTQRCFKRFFWIARALGLCRLRPAAQREVVLALARNIRARPFSETDACDPASRHVAPRHLAAATLSLRPAPREAAVRSVGSGLLRHHARRSARRRFDLSGAAASRPNRQRLRGHCRLSRKISLA